MTDYKTSPGREGLHAGRREQGCLAGEMGSSRGEGPRSVKWAGATDRGESFRGNRKSRSRGARGASVGTLGPSGGQARLQVRHGSPSQSAWCLLTALTGLSPPKDKPRQNLGVSPWDTRRLSGGPVHSLRMPGPAGPPLRPNDRNPLGSQLPSDHLLSVCGPGH